MTNRSLRWLAGYRESHESNESHEQERAINPDKTLAFADYTSR